MKDFKTGLVFIARSINGQLISRVLFQGTKQRPSTVLIVLLGIFSPASAYSWPIADHGVYASQAGANNACLSTTDYPTCDKKGRMVPPYFYTMECISDNGDRYMYAYCGTNENTIAEHRFHYPYYQSLGCPAGTTAALDTGKCQEGSPNTGSPKCGAGNPVSIATGNKFQAENDYLTTGPLALSIHRYYNSDVEAWRFASQAKLNIGYDDVLWVQEDGKGILFEQHNNELVWQAAGYPNINLTEPGDNTLRLVDSSRITHVFDSDGRLRSTTDLQGNSLAYQYDTNGNLQTVTHSNGQTLTYSYNAEGQISAIQTAADGTFNYAYSNGMLTRVTNPDNTTRTYLYEDSSHPQALTGIIDERGNRFATWAYDTEGRAILSEHAGAVEKTQLVFNDDGSTTVTNSLNKSTTYHFTIINGAKKVIQVEGHASASCLAANKNYTYTSNGLLETKTDWQGNVTRHKYNTRGLRIKTTKAEGSPEEQITEIEWHPTLDLPSKILEPNRETQYEYDVQGRLTKQTVSPKAAP
ncbi:MAG: hypothetical protein KUG81_04455 [Gammaproteobacteria bacterium]|nr:hypothetical protein [Gammaproteobacteria bacterium]